MSTPVKGLEWTQPMPNCLHADSVGFRFIIFLAEPHESNILKVTYTTGDGRFTGYRTLGEPNDVETLKDTAECLHAAISSALSEQEILMREMVEALKMAYKLLPERADAPYFEGTIHFQVSDIVFIESVLAKAQKFL